MEAHKRSLGRSDCLFCYGRQVRSVGASRFSIDQNHRCAQHADSASAELVENAHRQSCWHPDVPTPHHNHSHLHDLTTIAPLEPRSPVALPCADAKAAKLLDDRFLASLSTPHFLLPPRAPWTWSKAPVRSCPRSRTHLTLRPSPSHVAHAPATILHQAARTSGTLLSRVHLVAHYYHAATALRTAVCASASYALSPERALTTIPLLRTITTTTALLSCALLYRKI